MGLDYETLKSDWPPAPKPVDVLTATCSRCRRIAYHARSMHMLAGKLICNYCKSIKMQIEDHWCGGKADLEADCHVVRCSACKTYGEVMDSPEFAISEWNRHMLEVRQLHGREGRFATRKDR